MPVPALLDVLLVLLLLVFLVYGYRSGLVRSLSGIVGMVAGGIAAFFVVPLLGAWVPSPEWRTPATLAAAIVLVLAGLSLGASVGYALRRQVDRIKLRVVDRALGAALTTVAAALIASMLAFTIGALGVPMLTTAIASSTVIRTIDALTPTQVRGFLAEVRSIAVDEGIPSIVEAFQGPTPEIPNVTTDSPELTEAARSVVRITGNAYSCGQNQSGSGFVVAPGRVVTNAHVVAGVTVPVVEAPGLGALPGRVVYFDPIDDLAVIAVDALTAAPLERGPNLGVGTAAVSSGHPFGGPFDSDAAEVISVGPLNVADIYGNNPTSRQVYTLASDVQVGESGGPLLSESGVLAGVIFAKSATTDKVGYALAMDEVEPVAVLAPSLESAVSSGACTTS
ncbi:MarP family serine protease [Marisediminicola antarctica]|uniref:Colicin V production protein n=1 Tax=Marisediminicola antarctica TaxID=674079 RepID=A0A7L5AJJ0_9MICO|nr:MarP family serine protease [Marisediminicola antarctica]QHO70507.1 colicin V production protein [Marisediminicola antarctica]